MWQCRSFFVETDFGTTTVTRVGLQLFLCSTWSPPGHDPFSTRVWVACHGVPQPGQPSHAPDRRSAPARSVSTATRSCVAVNAQPLGASLASGAGQVALHRVRRGPESAVVRPSLRSCRRWERRAHGKQFRMPMGLVYSISIPRPSASKSFLALTRLHVSWLLRFGLRHSVLCHGSVVTACRYHRLTKSGHPELQHKTQWSDVVTLFWTLVQCMRVFVVCFLFSWSFTKDVRVACDSCVGRSRRVPPIMANHPYTAGGQSK